MPPAKGCNVYKVLSVGNSVPEIFAGAGGVGPLCLVVNLQSRKGPHTVFGLHGKTDGSTHTHTHTHTHTLSFFPRVHAAHSPQEDTKTSGLAQ